MIQKILRRALPTLLLGILLCALILPTAALTPYNTFSADYQNSVYCTNLCSLNLTGDERTDIVMVALSQLGYHEGDSDRDFAGGNSTGTRNFVEYNRLHGKVDNNEGNGVSYGYYWCASFATWCARQAGVPTSVITSEISCRRLVDWFSKYSTYKTASSGYIPGKGDLIFFRETTSSGAAATHIGIVLYEKNGTVYTVEGNTKAGCVGVRSYNLSNALILGYAVPDYQNNAETAIDYKSAADTAPGQYIVDGTPSLNLRAGPGTSYDSLGAVGQSRMVKISEIKNGWGKTSVDGKIGWLSLSYLELVCAERYPIAFEAAGGTGLPETQFKTHGKSLTLPTTVPTRRGHDFVGYATAADATTPDYHPGDLYTPNSAVTLYALWRPCTYTVTFTDAKGEILTQKAYPYGSLPTEPTPPQKSPDAAYSYTFAGWDKPVGTVTGDTVYKPTYSTSDNYYTITFLDDNGNELTKLTGKYGDVMNFSSYPGKSADDTYRYEFAGWDKPVTPIEGDATYTACYTPIFIEYTVTFLDIEGNVIEEQTYHYNDTPDPPAIPYNEEHEKNTATWDRVLEPVREDTTYRAILASRSERLLYDLIHFVKEPSTAHISPTMIVMFVLALLLLALAVIVLIRALSHRRKDR